jgi:streptogramin lyase
MTPSPRRCARATTACLAAFVAALAGCEGSLAPEEPVGRVTLALTAAPADVACLRVLVRSTIGPQEALRRLTVLPGQSTTFTITGLPLGEVQLTTEGFSVACANIGATTAPTWVGDTRTLVLTPSFIPSVTVTMHRPGSASVAVDFDTNPPPPTIQEVPLPGGDHATRLALAPDGSIVFTSPGFLGRATFPGPGTYIAKTFGDSYAVAVAPSGDIWLTRVSPNADVQHYSAAGLLFATFTLPGGTLPRDLAIDGAGTVWAGATGLPQIARIQGNAMSLIPVPSPTVLGIAVGLDGLVRVSLDAPGRIGVLSTAGPLTQQIPTPQPPADLIRGAGTDFWFLTQNGTALGRLTGGVATVIPIGAPGGSEGTLVLRSDGRVWFSQPDLGRLGRIEVATGAFTIVPLPAGTRPLGLAQDSANRLWIADANNARLLVVLP